ncbi:MAG: hypothetical protein KAI86_17730, partial [Desulfobacterales bacterium]|nr:hypothetical protein [Desulfobacterales bacterium]
TPTYESLDIYIVKIVGTKQFKRLVLNPTVFESYGHLNYGDVQTITQAEMDTYTTSSLVRVDTDPDEKVYAMAPDGDIGSKGWVNLTSTQFIDEAGSDADSIYTINAVDGGNYTTVGDVTTVAELTTFYSTGDLPSTTPVPVGGDLAVALAATTPASMTIPTNSSVEFTRVNLSAGDEATSVTAIKVTASGLGLSTNLDDVTLYVDGLKVGTSKNVNSSKEAIFNFSTPVELAASATKELSIKATAAAAGIYALGIKVAADVTTAGGTVTGSFPVTGNTMSADATTAVGTVTLSALSTTASTPNFGEDNVLLAGFDLTPANEAVLWESMRLRNGGTNVDGIVSNLRLVVDGTEVATAEPVNGDIDFAVGNYRIEKNSAASIEVYGDIGV